MTGLPDCTTPLTVSVHRLCSCAQLLHLKCKRPWAVYFMCSLVGDTPLSPGDGEGWHLGGLEEHGTAPRTPELQEEGTFI